MKRIISFLLALVLFCAMLPHCALWANASNTRWEVTNSQGVSGEGIVAEARKWANSGVAYVPNGLTGWPDGVAWRTGLGSTVYFDCIGFVSRVLNDCGFRSPSNPTPDGGSQVALYNKYGSGYISCDMTKWMNYGPDLSTAVSKARNGDYSDLRPGDIIGWLNNGGNHVVIFAGYNNGTPWMVEFTGNGYLDRAITSDYQNKFQYVARFTTVTTPSMVKTTYPAYCAIQVTDTYTYVKSMPCSKDSDPNSTDIEKATKGTTYVAIGLTENKFGNMWYKVMAKKGGVGYIYAGDTKYLANGTGDITGPGITVPANHQLGKPYTLSGSVKTVGNRLTKIAVYIYNGTNTSASPVTGGEESVSIVDGSYALGGSSIDYVTYFNYLPTGTFTYVVSAYYENYYATGAKAVSKANTGKVQVYKATFNVVSSAASCSHSYSGKVTTSATCVKNGVKTYTCSKCGTSYTETIAATGKHSYSSKVTKAATCGKTGVRTYTCSGCSASYTETIAATGNHRYLYTVTKEATCSSTGVRTYSCPGCSDSYTETIPAKGHNYVKSICSRCGHARGYTYVVSGGKATITDYTGKDSDIIIPATINGYTVTAIGTSAFDYSENLTSVVIPDSITVIGDSAFDNCTGLTSVTLPNSITSIGFATFYNCNKLKNVEIPAGVKKIGVRAFEKCTSLIKVTIPASVTVIDYKAFYNCTKLSSVNIPNGATIGNYAFTGCAALNSVKITVQPKNGAAPSGKTAAVTVKATGDGLSYTWYHRNVGATKYAKAPQTGATYSAYMSSSSNGRYVYCIVKDQYGNSVKTNTVRLYMGNTVKITVQPKTCVVRSGKTASVTVKATGDGLTYTWYHRNANASKFAKAPQTGATYSAYMSASSNGRYVYCIIKDQYGNQIKTDTVKLCMGNPIKITAQPKTVTVANGKTATVKVKATGDGLTYTWYHKNAAASKFAKAPQTGTTYSARMSGSSNGRYVYCIVRDKYGCTVKTNTVTLKMK